MSLATPSMIARFTIRKVLTAGLIAAFCAGLVVFFYLWLLRPYVYVEPCDLVIRNGLVLDGLGNPAFRADIGIRDGRIVAIGSVKKTSAERTIDAEGQIVAPGFIDVHTHIERNLPEGSRPFNAPNFIYQGVTTIVTGNCGTSVLSMKDMFKRLRRNGSQVNVASFIGHNTIRRKVMKTENREPTSQELEKMRNLVSKAMKQGSLGLSTGLSYVPGAYAKKEELITLARVAARNGGLYVSHIRDEGLRGDKAIEEACEIGKGASIPVHISHFKAAGRSQWGTAEPRLALVEQALRDGIRVTIDQYPYTASSTGLEILVPSWALAGESSEVKGRLRNPKTRVRIRSEMLVQLHASGWTDYSFARIAYCSSSVSLNGLSIPQATALQVQFAQRQQPSAQTSGSVVTRLSTRQVVLKRVKDSRSNNLPERQGQVVSGHPNSLTDIASVERQADAILDLIVKGGAQMVYFEMDDYDVVTIMKHTDTMFGSDSAVRSENTEAVPHPRGMGTFPRVLSRYVREDKVLSLEEAVRRMTSLPAKIFGIKDRGQIGKGYWADLVIFSQEHIADLASYDDPLKHPQGIHGVVVNGVVVFENDHLTGETPGRPIRRE